MGGKHASGGRNHRAALAMIYCARAVACGFVVNAVGILRAFNHPFRGVRGEVYDPDAVAAGHVGLVCGYAKESAAFGALAARVELIKLPLPFHARRLDGRENATGGSGVLRFRLLGDYIKQVVVCAEATCLAERTSRIFLLKYSVSEISGAQVGLQMV